VFDWLCVKCDKYINDAVPKLGWVIDFVT